MAWKILCFKWKSRCWIIACQCIPLSRINAIYNIIRTSTACDNVQLKNVFILHQRRNVCYLHFFFHLLFRCWSKLVVVGIYTNPKDIRTFYIPWFKVITFTCTCFMPLYFFVHKILFITKWSTQDVWRRKLYDAVLCVYWSIFCCCWLVSHKYLYFHSWNGIDS